MSRTLHLAEQLISRPSVTPDDAGCQAILIARLAPLEARLSEIEGRDPRSALDGFAARLEAMQARLDTPVENPFSTRLRVIEGGAEL